MWKAHPLTEALRYGRAMRLPAVLAVTLAVLVVSGCGTPDPVVVPEPESTSTPLFASDEEALAAAEEAYAAYLAVVDQIFADGGINPERLLGVATESVYEDVKEGFENYAADGNRSTGQTSFDRLTLQSADLSGFAVTEAVIVYVCEDYSGTDVLNSAGESITVAGRQTRWPTVVTFDVSDLEGAILIVSNVDDWTGADFCVA